MLDIFLSFVPSFYSFVYVLDTSPIRPLLIIMNERQRERHGLRELGVVFVKAILPENFPRHLRKTFQKIRSFRSIDLATFNLSDPSVLPERVLWRSEITNRAKKIVKIAEALIEDAPAEMGVRFDLEQKVLSRFKKIIEW